MRTMTIDPDELLFAGVSQAKLAAMYVVTVCTMIFLMQLWCNFHGRHDPLAVAVVHNEFMSVDGWSFVHVSFYCGFGFLMPNHFGTTFVGGILFECLEAWISRTPVTELQVFWEERGINSLWDLFFNTMGFRLGQVLLVCYVWRKRASAQHSDSSTKKTKKKRQ
eukprot:Rhum_TRINITY_DN19216_c0_g1::Rhum_TRINITY_DN19216_c0_g1_i1::g.169559::m.169559